MEPAFHLGRVGGLRYLEVQLLAASPREARVRVLSEGIGSGGCDAVFVRLKPAVVASSLVGYGLHS
jgi:hypothetical protein